MKKLMKLFKKNADERELQEFMRIERIGFWTMFYGVAIAIVVQSMLPGARQRDMAGEFVLLLAGGVVAVVGYARNGLWSPRFKMSVKSNLIISLAAGVIVAGIAAARIALFDVPTLWPFVPTVLFQFALTFVVAFGVSAILKALVKKRRTKLEAEVEDAGEGL